MRAIAIALFGLTLAAPAFADEPAAPAAPPRPVLAVFELEAPQSGLEPAEVDLLADDLCRGLEQDGVYEVVGPRLLKKALIEGLQGKFEECFDQICQFAVGQEVGADLALSSRLSRIGRQCLVTVVLWDIERKVSEHTAAGRSGCDLRSLEASVAQVARKLRAYELRRSRRPRPPAEAESKAGR